MAEQTKAGKKIQYVKSFEKFIASKYTDFECFFKICKGKIDLEIYICIYEYLKNKHRDICLVEYKNEYERRIAACEAELFKENRTEETIKKFKEAVIDIRKELLPLHTQCLEKAAQAANEEFINMCFSKFINNPNMTPREQLSYLASPSQPGMNINEALYDVCTKYIVKKLKTYIVYNGFLMNNSDGTAEDWTEEFYLKYIKICKFYKDRWFHKELLKKESKVPYNKILYKEFIYICRMSISGERRHRAFLATQHPGSSLFKASLDFKTDSKQKDKTVLDTYHDQNVSHDIMVDETNIRTIQDKALELCKQYENGKWYNQILTYYTNQDTTNHKNKEVVEKKAALLGKIFLYKAGLYSPKVLAFIKSLSTTYKTKFNISSALVAKQCREMKSLQKVSKIPTYEEILEDEGKTRIGLLLRKRSN